MTVHHSIPPSFRPGVRPALLAAVAMLQIALPLSARAQAADSRITQVKVRPDRVRDVIGSGGKNIRQIISETGVTIDVEDDGTVTIASSDAEAAARAVQMVKWLTEDAEIGKIYRGTVKKVVDFGAFVEILPGTEGLVHISQLDKERVKKVTDIVNEGDEVLVKVIEIDKQGKIRLSRKDALGADVS